MRQIFYVEKHQVAENPLRRRKVFPVKGMKSTMPLFLSYFLGFSPYVYFLIVMICLGVDYVWRMYRCRVLNPITLLWRFKIEFESENNSFNLYSSTYILLIPLELLLLLEAYDFLSPSRWDEIEIQCIL